MGKNRKTYSETFKKQVSIDAMDSKKPVAEIVAENNISPGMVSSWKKAFINGEFSKELRPKQLEEKTKQLEAATLALGKAQLEIELIKKKRPFAIYRGKVQSSI